MDTCPYCPRLDDHKHFQGWVTIRPTEGGYVCHAAHDQTWKLHREPYVSMRVAQETKSYYTSRFIKNNIRCTTI